MSIFCIKAYAPDYNGGKINAEKMSVLFGTSLVRSFLATSITCILPNSGFIPRVFIYAVADYIFHMP